MHGLLKIYIYDLDRESNPEILSAEADAPTTKQHQPGFKEIYLRKYLLLLFPEINYYQVYL